ncbi:MAG: M48 family metallopeptidase [Crocosphaera sp.]|uniref:M48 family metallopeptidase n=1 Tax=Crocosphaera sp. TaxID=2729996 RepID=UPI002585CCAE|nr:M48 family metallopeptidase [Crocosphaera sp.]MCH2248016.1 M48 family metallopeptidase [Crocosphaera sp.]
MWKKITTITTILSLGWSFNLPLKAQSISNSPLREETTILAQNNSRSVYQQAKEDLPEDYYIVYRLTERILRANELDNLPWRIIIKPGYEINAFATQANLIGMGRGLLDQLSGNVDGIACVIGHEITHHLENHIALGPEEEAQILAQIRREAEQQVMREIEETQRTTTGINLLGEILGQATGSYVDTSGINQELIQQAQERVQEIVTQKEREFAKKIAANNHRQEFEADHGGVFLALKAGFNPQGCIDVMNVIGRLQGTQSDGVSHPSVPRRIKQLENLIQSIETKVSEENNRSINIAMMTEHFSQKFKEKDGVISSPLSYQISRDGNSLRINPQGGTTADIIEEKLDQ